jgi:hypothetical protein
MTALLPSIQRYHNHRATATPRSATAACVATCFIFFILDFFYPNTLQTVTLHCHPCSNPLVPGTKMTALLRSIQRYHNHRATATPRPAVAVCVAAVDILCSSRFFFNLSPNCHFTLPRVINVSCVWHQNDRPAPLYPTVPQFLYHCHSPFCHGRLCCGCHHFFNLHYFIPTLYKLSLYTATHVPIHSCLVPK